MRRGLATGVLLILALILSTIGLAENLSPQEVQRLTLANKDKIPSLIQETLPAGAKWTYHLYGRDYLRNTFVTMEYQAERDNPEPLILYPNTGYSLDCHVIDPKDPLRQTFARNYLPMEYQKLKAAAQVENAPGFVRTAQEKDEAWGKSVTVREVHTPLNKSKSYTFYHLQAAGRVGDVLFRASATCMPDDKSRGEEWFNKLIGSMKKWSVSNLTI